MTRAHKCLQMKEIIIELLLVTRSHWIVAELEAARPTSTGEEELQLELALAMSKEEHEQQMKLMKGDEVKLQMALEQSKKESEEEARLKQVSVSKMFHSWGVNISNLFKCIEWIQHFY